MVISVWVAVGLPVVGLVVGLLSWVIYQWIWKPWSLVVACQKQGISGFPFIPFVGQLLQISKVLIAAQKDSGNDWEALKSAQKCVEMHGKVFYFITGKTVRINIADPDLLKDVLASNADSYSKPSFIHVLNILGDGLFASSGQVWSPQRKLLGLSFGAKEIKTEMGIIISYAHSAVNEWLMEMDTNSGELDIYQRLLELTVNVITKLAFGAEKVSESKFCSRVAGAFDRYLLNNRELVFGPAAAIPGYRFLPTRTNKEISKDQKFLSSIVEELIQDRLRAYGSRMSEQMDRKDILDLLIGAVQGNSPQEVSSQQLRDNSLTILLAGHHTTASLLTWTMYLLALHPLWQERARAEVEEFCREGIEWSTLSSLKTITMILQETLRLFPPIPLIGRLCLKENSVGPYVIPQGVEILIPTAVIHRDKDLWGEDADQFVPMRFANGISKACKHNLGYLPFGYGPRTCIGQILALAEARAVLGVILPAFAWKIGPGYRHSPDISLSLKPKFSIPIIMEKL